MPERFSVGHPHPNGDDAYEQLIAGVLLGGGVRSQLWLRCLPELDTETDIVDAEI